MHLATYSEPAHDGVPTVGEDTAQALTELGLTPSELENWPGA
jgi:hypothetical protein